jgi:hypothetical protein
MFTMAPEIERFILSLPQHKQQLSLLLRDIFLSAGKLTEAIKWGNLTFSHQGNIAFIYTFSQQPYVNVGFMRATELSDPKGLFEGTGKGMRHIKVRTEKDIPVTQLRKWIKEAVALDERTAKPASSAKKRGRSVK